MRDLHSLAHFYADAKSWILSSPFKEELIWQNNLDWKNVTERDFLREHAWVVLNSGFKESVVRKHFGYISLCFCDWESAEEISSCGDICITTAMSAFRNRAKLNAILNLSRMIAQEGFQSFFSQFDSGEVEDLQRLPFIGGVTCYHLAKNLGFQSAKPDRHLERLAEFFHFASTAEMCIHLSEESGDDIATIDLVLWRHLEQVSGKALREHLQQQQSPNGMAERAFRQPLLAA